MQLNVLTEMVTKLKDFAGFSLGVPMFLPTRVHDTSLTLYIGAEIQRRRHVVLVFITLPTIGVTVRIIQLVTL